MGFGAAKTEVRVRFSESRLLLDSLRRSSPPDLTPVDETQKALRGLWLVSLYAAVERSANAVVEAAIADISSRSIKSFESKFNLHGIFHYSKVQAVNSCSRNSLFDKSADLFEIALGDGILSMTENPLAESLQNVDAKALSWILKLFGAPAMTPAAASIGRTNSLRERRNAVAHGRESASEAGGRYELTELENLYKAADEVVSAFILSLEEHCATKGYLRQMA